MSCEAYHPASRPLVLIAPEDGSFITLVSDDLRIVSNVDLSSTSNLKFALSADVIPCLSSIYFG